MPPGEPRDEGRLQRVLDGGAAADRRQDVPEAGKYLEAIPEFGLGRTEAAHRRRQSFRVARWVVPTEAARDAAHEIEDGASVDDDRAADGPYVRRLEPGGPDDPVERGVVIMPERFPTTGEVISNCQQFIGMTAEEFRVGRRHDVHEMPGRDRIRLEGRRVERALPHSIPGREHRPPGREGAEGDGPAGERLVKDDQIGDDLAQDPPRPAPQARQALTIDARDDCRLVTTHELPDRLRVRVQEAVIPGDQHERVDHDPIEITRSEPLGSLAKSATTDHAHSRQELDAMPIRQVPVGEPDQAVSGVEHEPDPDAVDGPSVVPYELDRAAERLLEPVRQERLELLTPARGAARRVRPRRADVAVEAEAGLGDVWVQVEPEQVRLLLTQHRLQRLDSRG